MMCTPHILAGAAVAKLLRYPALAYPAAFVSHLVLDAIPHLDAQELLRGPDGAISQDLVMVRLLDALVGGALLVWLVWPRVKKSRSRHGPGTGAWDARKWGAAKLGTRTTETRKLDTGRWDKRKWDRRPLQVPGKAILAALSLPLWGALFAMLPDLLDSVPPWGPFFRHWPATAWFSSIHHGIQPELPPSAWPLGVTTQLIVVALAVWALAAMRGRARSSVKDD